MTAQQILDALDIADEGLLQETDRLRRASSKKKPHKWFAIAACLCLLSCGAWLFSKPKQPTLPQPSEPHSKTDSNCQTATEQAEEFFQPYFNEINEAANGGLRQDVCLFAQPLSEAELMPFIPAKKPDWMKLTAHGLFLGDGSLRQVLLSASTTLPNVAVSVTLSKEKPFYDYVLPSKALPSYWNGVEFLVTRCTCLDGSTEIFAESQINNCYFTFSMHGSQNTRRQNEADFSQILQCFAESDVDAHSFDGISVREIPNIYDRSLTSKEALEHKTYGQYFLSEIPNGFQTERIHEYKDMYDAFLKGVWSKGNDELSWKVSCISAEDQERLTHTSETERYDLSLYPIPRADSVPEELQEVVYNPIFFAEELTIDLIRARAYRLKDDGDSTGWRMAFSVRFGNMIVEVRSKGVDPTWVFEQLCKLS